MHDKLNTLITAFATRGKDVEGVPAMLLGTLPLLRMQVRKVDADALDTMSRFLGNAFAKIGDESVSLAEFEQWLSELNPANA